MTIADEELKREITRRLEAFCAEHGHVLSESAESIIEDLVSMHRLLGNFYCPCQPDNVPETVCICSAVRNGMVEDEGACFCGLVLRGQEA